ncbi:hypothetical protein HNQ69_000704 [Bartonella callosciuri]|uniref:Uncharacterized protein n=1 Tax=Bartonella callosciuri TaxID=686223 RepID=A0A840NUH1_9HYPH|nr:hypothetical protein [Bartonella callosciuri]
MNTRFNGIKLFIFNEYIIESMYGVIIIAKDLISFND